MPVGQSATTTAYVQRALGMESERTYLVFFLKTLAMLLMAVCMQSW